MFHSLFFSSPPIQSSIALVVSFTHPVLCSQLLPSAKYLTSEQKRVKHTSNSPVMLFFAIIANSVVEFNFRNMKPCFTRICCLFLATNFFCGSIPSIRMLGFSITFEVVNDTLIFAEFTALPDYRLSYSHFKQ